MYGDQPLNFTLVAAVATGRYRIVLGSGANYGGQAVAANQTLVGVAQNEPLAGEHLTVAMLGKSRCHVNSAVTAFAKITASASGGAAPVVSGDTVIGFALEAGAPGDLIPVMLQPAYVAP
jgi:hypothetical protein